MLEEKISMKNDFNDSQQFVSENSSKTYSLFAYEANLFV